MTTHGQEESVSFPVSARSGGSVIAVYAQPRASRNTIVGIHDGRLKVTLTAPPVGGKANASLCSFLARRLGVAKGTVQVITGETGRRKSVFVAALSTTQVCDRLFP